MTNVIAVGLLSAGIALSAFTQQRRNPALPESGPVPSRAIIPSPSSWSSTARRRLVPCPSATIR